MWHVKGNEISLKETPSGELFSVLVGRHQSSGASKEQTVAIIELPPYKSSDAHFHKEREESYYFISGQGRARIDKEEVDVNNGDLIFSRPGQVHQFTNTGDIPLKYLVFTSPQWIPSDSFMPESNEI